MDSLKQWLTSPSTRLMLAIVLFGGVLIALLWSGVIYDASQARTAAALSAVVVLLVALFLRQAASGRRKTIAEQGALLTSILDAIPAGIWVKDDQGRFEIINHATARLIGRPKDDILGRRSDDVLPEDAVRAIAAWDRSARAEPGATITGEIISVIEGMERRYLTSRQVTRVAGQSLLVGSTVDITSLRHAEEALRVEMTQREAAEAQFRQAQKMEAIGQLTGGIAHDFNNMLTTILGNIELAQRGERDEARLKLLRTAAHAAQHGATLVDHLLAFARRQHLQPQPINLNEVIADLRKMLDRAIGATIAIETQLSQALWPAMADPNQIEVALLNIAINARDAMPTGGRLTIETANIDRHDPAIPEELPPHDYVAIIMTDTGTGMDDAVIARAFDPFFTTKEVGTGSGLGLSQVYGMAQQSGGTVKLNSCPGEGTVVRVYLPRAALPVRESEAQRGDFRVLVVDDEHQVRDFVVNCLDELGFHAIGAEDGTAALDVLDREAVDLALVDIALPGMPGPEVARHARHRQPQLAILFMTGHAAAPLMEQIGDAPVLKKPFGPARLATEIEHALAHRRPVIRLSHHEIDTDAQGQERQHR